MTEATHLPALRAGINFMTGTGLRRLIRHLAAGKPVLLTGKIWNAECG